MKQKNGFTLIELLAVIIILGILMIIAIPSVTRYIASSRDSSYITTVKEYIGSARNMVNSGKYKVYDTSTTYYVPIKCITLENSGDSPYGKFEKAYVLVNYNGKNFDYYFGGYDESGIGIKITKEENLSEDRLKRDMHEFDDRVAVDGRYTITKMDDNSCKFGNSTAALNSMGEIDIMDDYSKYTITHNYNLHKNDIENVTSYIKRTPTGTDYKTNNFSSAFTDLFTNYSAISIEYNDNTGKRKAKYYYSFPTIVENSTGNTIKVSRVIVHSSSSYANLSGDVSYSYKCEKNTTGNERFVELDCRMNTSASLDFCNNEQNGRCFSNMRGEILLELENGDIIDVVTYTNKNNNSNRSLTSIIGSNYHEMSINDFMIHFYVSK